MPATRLFSGASFIFAEFTDISFEVKVVLCLDFYAFRDVFRRSRRFEFLYNQCNRLERKILFPSNLTYLHHPSLKLRMAGHPAIRRFFLLAKTSEVKRSVRRMPSIAQRAAEGCAAANCDNRSTEATDNVLHLYFTQY